MDEVLYTREEKLEILREVGVTLDHLVKLQAYSDRIKRLLAYKDEFDAIYEMCMLNEWQAARIAWRGSRGKMVAILSNFSRVSNEILLDSRLREMTVEWERVNGVDLAWMGMPIIQGHDAPSTKPYWPSNKTKLGSS